MNRAIFAQFLKLDGSYQYTPKLPEFIFPS